MTDQNQFKEWEAQDAGRLATWAANQRNMGGGYSEIADLIDAALFRLSNGGRRADRLAATFQIHEMRSGEFKVTMVAPNGDTCCWTPRGERGQRVAKAANAALMSPI